MSSSAAITKLVPIRPQSALARAPIDPEGDLPEDVAKLTSKLTFQQAKFLDALAQGYTQTEAAQALGVAYKTTVLWSMTPEFIAARSALTRKLAQAAQATWNSNLVAMVGRLGELACSPDGNEALRAQELAWRHVATIQKALADIAGPAAPSPVSEQESFAQRLRASLPPMTTEEAIDLSRRYGYGV